MDIKFIFFTFGSMAKNKRVSLNLETYGNYEVIVIITDDIKKTRKGLDKELGFTYDNVDLNIDGLHSYNSAQMKSFILLNPDTSNGVIAHESFHCVVRVMKIIGGKLSNSSEESYAYLLDYLVDTIHAIKKNK